MSSGWWCLRSYFNSCNWCSPEPDLREQDSGSSGAQSSYLAYPLVIAGVQWVNSLFTLSLTQKLQHSFAYPDSAPSPGESLGLSSAYSSGCVWVTGSEFSGFPCVVPEEWRVEPQEQAVHVKASCPLCRISNPTTEDEDVTQKTRGYFYSAFSSSPS